MKRKADTSIDGAEKAAKKHKKDHHKHKSKDRKKDKHRDKDYKSSKDAKQQNGSKERQSLSPKKETKSSGHDKTDKQSQVSEESKHQATNGTIPPVTQNVDKLKLDKPEKQSPKKFHISNFTLGGFEKKDKSPKKKHRDKDRERKDNGLSKSSSKSKASHSGKMISSLYGTQTLEFKPSGSEAKTEQKRHKPPVKLERKVSRQKSEAEESLYHHVLKIKPKKDLMKEPYMPEYHEVKRYISKDVTGEFQHLLHVEVHANGGGLVLHSYQDEIDELPSDKQKVFVDEYMKLAFLEDDQQSAYFIMAIVHDSAKPMPDFIDYLDEKHPNMTVKMGTLGKSDIETMAMSEVKTRIYNAYGMGTYRAGPLLQLSLVGLAQEEVSQHCVHIALNVV